METVSTGERRGGITELFVEEPVRAFGVGEAICAGLVTFALDRGGVGVDGVALPGHRATKNSFEDQRLTARALVLHRPGHPEDG